jgi:hypothetical protein
VPQANKKISHVFVVAYGNCPEYGDGFIFPGVDKMGISVTKKTEKSCHPRVWATRLWFSGQV